MISICHRGFEDFEGERCIICGINYYDWQDQNSEVQEDDTLHLIQEAYERKRRPLPPERRNH